jgi:hypothetical protein
LLFFSRFQDWQSTLFRLQLVCAALGADEGCCFDLLLHLLESRRISRPEFFDHHLALFFWRPRHHGLISNPWFAACFGASPFSDSLPLPVHPPDLAQPAVLFALLALSDFEITFSLRLSPAGQWRDIDRARELLPWSDNLLLKLLVDRFSAAPANLCGLTFPDCPIGLTAAAANFQAHFGALQAALRALDGAQPTIEDLGHAVLDIEDGVAAAGAQDHRDWNALWSGLSIEKAPWDAGREVPRHWRRDPTPCFAFCPSKLKRNAHFDAHREASDGRDAGYSPEFLRAPAKQTLATGRGEAIIGPYDCRVLKVFRGFEGSFRVCRGQIEVLEAGHRPRIIPLSRVRRICGGRPCTVRRRSRFLRSMQGRI